MYRCEWVYDWGYLSSSIKLFQRIRQLHMSLSAWLCPWRRRLHRSPVYVSTSQFSLTEHSHTESWGRGQLHPNFVLPPPLHPKNSGCLRDWHRLKIRMLRVITRRSATAERRHVSSVGLSDTDNIFSAWTPRRSSRREDIMLTNQVLDYNDSRDILRLENVDKTPKLNLRINLGI